MFKEISSFDQMITPMIIKIVFWIGVIVSVIAGLALILKGANSYYGSGAEVFSGLLILVLGPLTTRIYCELLIVLFKMHESLNEIRLKLASADSEEDINS